METQRLPNGATLGIAPTPSASLESAILPGLASASAPLSLDLEAGDAAIKAARRALSERGADPFLLTSASARGLSDVASDTAPTEHSLRNAAAKAGFKIKFVDDLKSDDGQELNGYAKNGEIVLNKKLLQPGNEAQLRAVALEEFAEAAFQRDVGGTSKGDFGDAVASKALTGKVSAGAAEGDTVLIDGEEAEASALDRGMDKTREKHADKQKRSEAKTKEKNNNCRSNASTCSSNSTKGERKCAANAGACKSNASAGKAACVAKAGACAGNASGAAACNTDASACAGNASGASICAQKASGCAANATGVNTCGNNASGNVIKAEGAKVCGNNASVCAGKVSGADVCGSNASACAGNVGGIGACGEKASRCAAKVTGACGVDVSSCSANANVACGVDVVQGADAGACIVNVTPLPSC